MCEFIVHVYIYYLNTIVNSIKIAIFWIWRCFLDLQYCIYLYTYVCSCKVSDLTVPASFLSSLLFHNHLIIIGNHRVILILYRPCKVILPELYWTTRFNRSLRHDYCFRKQRRRLRSRMRNREDREKREEQWKKCIHSLKTYLPTNRIWDFTQLLWLGSLLQRRISSFVEGV